MDGDKRVTDVRNITDKGSRSLREDFIYCPYKQLRFFNSIMIEYTR